MPSFGNFVHTQFILNIPVPTASFAEKTVIVTGGNGGLGQEIIKHIVRLKASKVILACRSQSRGEKAKKDIVTATSCAAGVLEVWELDIASASSIKSFVAKVNILPRLDVVINNAGIQNAPFELIYGTERTLAVNVVGTMLLAIQLIPKLKETARNYKVMPHLTFVESALYDVAKYPETHGNDIFDWFQNEKHVNRMGQ
jgi:retinol dehydrogenase 12